MLLVRQTFGFQPIIVSLADVWPDRGKIELIVQDADLPSSRLVGRVLDPSGGVLKGVHMDLKQNPHGTLVPLGDSLADGTFQTRKLPRGEYRLSIHHPNFGRLQRLVVVNGEEMRDLGDLTLPERKVR